MQKGYSLTENLKRRYLSEILLAESYLLKTDLRLSCKKIESMFDCGFDSIFRTFKIPLEQSKIKKKYFLNSTIRIKKIYQIKKILTLLPDLQPAARWHRRAGWRPGGPPNHRDQQPERGGRAPREDRQPAGNVRRGGMIDV